jgi:putative chitinase
MCISAAVGESAPNASADVKVVQVLLNLCTGLGPAPMLEVDGRIGSSNSETVKRIRLFQERVVGLPKADGRVDPLPRGSLATLRARMTLAFTEMKLRGIMAQGRAGDIGRFYLPLMSAMHTHSITTPLRQAHFLGQLGHESGDFRYTEELASGDDYEGRADLGNTEPGDGRRFKGRGLIQLTGRRNYTDFGRAIGKELLTGDHPTLVASDPILAVEAAAWYWTKHDLNRLADADDVVAITRVINGGRNGLDDRQRRLARAKFFLVR